MYEEQGLMIDLVVLEFKCIDPEFIQRQVKDIFDHSISIGAIKDHFGYTEDYEKASYTVEMGEIF